jgi:putative membrane protein
MVEKKGDMKKGNDEVKKKSAEGKVSGVDVRSSEAYVPEKQSQMWKGEWKREYLIYGLVLLVAGFLTEFLINKYYSPGGVISSLFALVGVGTMFYFWNKGHYNFILTSILWVGFFSALSISFDLGFVLNYSLSILGILIFGLVYGQFRTTFVYSIVIFFASGIIFSFLGINAVNPDAWTFNSFIFLPFFIILLLVSLWFRFSKMSYSLIFVFLFFHGVGMHYSYSNVPLANIVGEMIGVSGFSYAFIVHILYGFLMFVPIREAYMRVSRSKGIWNLVIPLIILVGFEAFYNVILMLIGVGIGSAFVTKTVWESEREILLSFVGGFAMVFLNFLISLIRNSYEYLGELRASLFFD